MNIVAVVAQDGEILLHMQARMVSGVDDADTDVVASAVTICSYGRDGVQVNYDDDIRGVTDRHGCNCVDNLRTASQLHTALEHAIKKVVVVVDTGGSVSKDIARSDDSTEEAASASLADEPLRYLWSIRMDVTHAGRGLETTYPFGLALSGAKTGATAHHIICFHDSALPVLICWCERVMK